MISEIQPKRNIQNIVQCTFKITFLHRLFLVIRRALLTCCQTPSIAHYTSCILLLQQIACSDSLNHGNTWPQAGHSSVNHNGKLAVSMRVSSYLKYRLTLSHFENKYIFSMLLSKHNANLRNFTLISTCENHI